MLEWTASVSTAIEPVTVPASTFRMISVAFDAIDRPAARVLAGAGAAAVIRSALGQPSEQQPDRAPAVADRVLLGIAELGHRAAAGVVGRQERGVVAEPA